MEDDQNRLERARVMLEKKQQSSRDRYQTERVRIMDLKQRWKNEEQQAQERYV